VLEWRDSSLQQSWRAGLRLLSSFVSPNVTRSMLFAAVGTDGRRRGVVAACSVAVFLAATSTNNAWMTWAVRTLAHVPTPAVIMGIQATVAALTNVAVIALMALVLWPLLPC
jgi:hypothetical protein